MKKLIIISLCLLLVGSGCVSDEKKANTLTLSGAFALYPMAVKWSEMYKKTNEQVRFNISGGGAGKGMADALAQTVDLGMFSREIAPEELAQGVWWVGLCKDAVLPTISASHPYLSELQARGITREEFVKIFINGTITDWNELLPGKPSLPMQVYTRSDACGAAGTWAKYLNGKKQEDLKGIGIHGDPALADAVGKDNAGVGFNNTAYIYDVTTGAKHPGMEVLPIDLNENGEIDAEEAFYDTFEHILSAIAKEQYPSPPARELYFVAKGKPQKQATLDFIRWALTEGQQYVKEAGYVPITEDKLAGYLKKIE